MKPPTYLRSDMHFDTSAFDPSNIPQQTKELNFQLIEACSKDTKWWSCGAQEYRRRRAAGETPFPSPVTLPRGTWRTIHSPEGVSIPLRILEPLEPPRGVFYHIHGGGYVLGSAGAQDLLLDEISNTAKLVVVSVEYRLAPEHPYPAALEDCNFVADWLVRHSKKEWECDITFIGGESAGASLASLVLLHLRNSARLSTIKGAVLNYGQYDLSHLPSIRQLDPDRCLILGRADGDAFLSTYLPGYDSERRKLPTISAAYNDLQGLPSALFIVGTEDGLIDDTLLMAAKWRIAGNESILKFVPGACHGFMVFNGHEVECARQGWDLMLAYLQSLQG